LFYVLLHCYSTAHIIFTMRRFTFADVLSKTRLTLSFARIITEQGIFLWQDSFIRMKHSLAAFESALPSRDYAKLSTGNGAGLRALNWTLLHKRGCSLFLSSFARNGNPDYGNYNVRRARRVTKAWRFFHAYDAPADLLKKRLKKDEESCDSNACLRTQWKLKIWKIWKICILEIYLARLQDLHINNFK